jgi:hypothetical protein
MAAIVCYTNANTKDQGAGQKPKKIGDPRGSEHEKGLATGTYFFPGSTIFLVVFLASPHRSSRNAQKRDKNFSTRFLCGVFELPSPKNTRKRDKTKKSRGKTDIEICIDSLFSFLFRHGLFVKTFLWWF